MTEGNSRLPALRPETAPLRLAVSDAPRPDEFLSIRVRYEPGYVLITVAGEIDYATVTGLRERLFALASTGRTLVADLDRVSFIDATGMGVLAGTARRAAAHGAGLHVICGRRRIRWLFGLTGLDRAVQLAASLAEALAGTAGGTAGGVGEKAAAV